MKKLFCAADTPNPDIKAVILKHSGETVAQVRLPPYMHYDVARASSFLNGFVQLFEKEFESNKKSDRQDKE